MATFTRLASTLTARYFPSNTLTDSFYMDGRLFGKREARLADITIDKEDRGFFFSIFSHAAIPGYEPGMMPPYEATLRNTCNEVKYGRKEIDGIIEGFLSTAVDVTGKMRLADSGEHNPYFSGYIVRDGEVFAVTIGTGLAFLYRDETLFPLTEAGISMEPIDTHGNKVSDFYSYCSSKTANALWSNFFNFCQDDCIILCNKEVYDALGQRELLRILDEAEDQCDAAGTVITQASARMPNVPMQFAISFCENVSKEEKKGLFGFKKKHKEPETDEMDNASSFDSGIVGAAAEAVAGAGVAAGAAASSVAFGDAAAIPVPPLDTKSPITGFEFLDNSIPKAPTEEISAEELMKNALNDMKKSEQAAQPMMSFNPFSEEKPEEPKVEQTKPEEDIFVASTPVEDEDLAATKTANIIDSSFIQQFGDKAGDENSIIAAAIKQYTEEKKADAPSQPELSVSDGTIELIANDESEKPQADDASDAEKPFDPYSVGNADEMKNAAPLVFGDFSMSEPADNSGAVETGNEVEIPVPEFEIKPDIDTTNPPVEEVEGFVAPDYTMDTPKVEAPEEEKLNINFPSDSDVAQEDSQTAETEPEEEFTLPFENKVETIPSEEEKTIDPEDIPDMPLYNAETFDAPTSALNSDQPINAVSDKSYAVGGYVENEDMAAAEPEVPYRAYGQEGGQYEPAPQPEVQAPVQPEAQPYEPQSYEPEQNYYNYSEEQAPASEYNQYYGEGNMSDYSQPQPQDANPNAQGQQAADNSDWINDLLGINDNDSDMYGAQVEQGVPASVYTGREQTQRGPSQQGQRRPQSPQGQRRPQQGRPHQSGSGRGGNGGNGGRRKLTRNGMYFLIFVAFLLICLIIIISLIVKSCSKDDTNDTDVSQDTAITNVAGETTESVPVSETTPAAVVPSPYDPIGVFVFSDNIGYRTMWDVVNKVYGINDNSDVNTMINNILAYNGYDSTYSPVTGSTINLPSADIVNGNLPATPSNGGATGETTASTNSVVNGDITLGETTASTAAVGQ